MPAAIKDIARELDELAPSALSVEELMTLIVGRLKERVPHYDWVGFYMIETGSLPDEGDVLVLGPYVGAPTPHTRIPLDQGICGAAGASGKTIIVDDVAADPRYLSCSVETKSEIVVPVRVHDKIVGELDIDSHTPAAFTAEDRDLVEHCAALVGRYLENRAS